MNVTRRRSWVAPAEVVASTISEPSSAGTDDRDRERQPGGGEVREGRVLRLELRPA